MFTGRRSASRLRRVLAAAICLAGTNLVFAIPQDRPSQQAVQTGPIDEPRGAEKEPTGPPIRKGKEAITQVNAKCSTKLSVSADALFKANRWTLNPDAFETMNVLGPMVAKAGKHPARVDSYTDSTGSDSDNQSVSEKRAITIRGWLINHGYLPEGTPIQGFGGRNPVAPNTRPDGSDDPKGRQQNRRIEVVIDTCRSSK